ncbi:MAG: hypothetical protein HQK84_03780 [Nitrospinae bacterium]|nr:hypothetical protein [Nitrospinota bacterium]
MIEVNYVTSSKFKKEENCEFSKNCKLTDGSLIKDIFKFTLHTLNIAERLEVDIEEMVKHEVKEAYSSLRIPCIVEHAGLIFKDYDRRNYPGGLTKPLWNTLGDDFILETNSSNREATARAVIGYCDGKTIKTFIGETKGFLADKPRGDRKFYWDTVFIPDKTLNLTYAEIVQQKGLDYKLIHFSQSAKAMIKFLEFLRNNHDCDLWG